MPTVDGTFPDAHGAPQPRTRLPVEATKSAAQQYQISVDGVGRGTITMRENVGDGQFLLLNGETLTFDAMRLRDGLGFRLSRQGQEIANGIIRDLPP